ncbi:Transposase for insertion sequence element IS905 [Bienertia sinuspersici]
MTVNKDDNYFNKLYENGELYTNQEWGKIELKPWQLFTNKHHLRNIWEATVLLEDIRASNDISVKALNELLWERYKVKMTKSTFYRMRNEALIEIYRGHDVSYSYLPKYCEKIKKKNPNSLATCGWKILSTPKRPLVFNGIFISFRGVLNGLLAGCRSLVGVHGCHLSGNYAGIFLSTVALDGNNELFPFAWAIIPGEDKASWRFFIWHLKNILQESGRVDEWCIISDRQKGIDCALNELWPTAGRRYCCKHLAGSGKNLCQGL